LNIAKYFWDLNDAELAKARRILRDPAHPRFVQRIVTLLSRCDRPKELFSIVPRKRYVEAWPKIRTFWLKRERRSEQRDWWDTLYEQLVPTASKVRGDPSLVMKKLGSAIKEKRVEMGLSQMQLARRTQLTQPAVSAIEEGKKNLTLFTLIRLCKMLEIRSLDVTSE